MSATNADGSRNIARAAAQHRARLVHLSSDVIFDGEHAPYTENDTPAPITSYGESKVRAERAVIEECSSAVLVRTSLIYGFDPIDPRTQQILDGAMPRLFTDEYRCPIFVDDLADALIEIAGAQRLSRYKLGVKLANAFHTVPRFEPALCASHPAPRPRDCTLDISRAQRILKTKLRGVDDVLPRINE
jgi:dTDP-4-dehydrorhamnose reductase